ncbi:MAG: BNR repeat-containing protein [Balneolales bacterium]
MKARSCYIPVFALCAGLLVSCSGSGDLTDTAADNRVVNLVPLAKGYAKTAVNVTIFRRNSVFTHEQSQYAAYYDPEGHLMLARRELGDTTWKIHQTQYAGNVRDAHNSISIMVDGAGYLHVSWDHHNHPLRYARGLRPGSLELGQREQMSPASAGHRVTYPEFYRMPDGDLLFMYRHGGSGDGAQVLHRYDVSEGSWSLLHEQLIDGQGRVNPYWQTTIDEAGTLHLSWTWRRNPGVESNHDMAYARSGDGGRTWERSDGEEYELPITPGTAEYALRIPENSVMMNQTSMAADSRGNPYIVNYWRPEGSEVPQYHIVHHDGESWQVSQLGHLTQAFDLRGGGSMAPPISRPQIAVDTSGEQDRAYVIFRAEERGSKVSVAISNNPELGEWSVIDLADLPLRSWEPSYDTSLWQREKKLHLFVQQAGQLPHETPDEDMEPQMIYILEWDPARQAE